MRTPEQRSIRRTGSEIVAVAAAAASLSGLARLRSRDVAKRLAEKDRLLAVLRDRVAAGDAEARLRQGRLHEITATVGALAAASEVLPGLPSRERHGMESMIGAELQRLRRLLAGDTGETDDVLDVGAVVDRLVAAHRALGRRISWRGTDVRALGSGDALAQALNVLLANAARHGCAQDISVEVRVRETVEVRVVDGGPGVPALLRTRIFDWGVRRDGSPGQGIGLYGARELVRSCGGDLRLAGTDGACFVIELPSVHRALAHYSEALAG